MRGRAGKQVAGISLLGLVCLFAIGREFGRLDALAPWAGGALLIWVVLEWRELALIAKLPVCVAVLAGAVVVTSGTMSPELLAGAVGRSAFFTFFLMSMDVLRTAAMSSRMVLDTGRTIVSQPPGRRYAMITIGGHLFSILLNLGAVTLLGAMNRRSIEASGPEVSDDIKEIRLQRMTLALIRGFTSFTMWAPTSVTTVVVLAAIPDIDWYQYAPVGLVLVLSYLLLGWIFDRLSHNRSSAVTRTRPLRQVLASLLPMTALTFAILSVAAMLSWLGGIRLIAALLLTVPAFGVGWVFVQYQRAGAVRALLLTRRRLVRRILPDLVTMRSEIALLSSAGFIAALLPHLIDTDQLGRAVAGLGLTEGWLLAGLLWFVALTAPIGLNPIISVAVSVEILSRLSAFDFDPYLLALGGICSWGLATGMSPIGTTLRISGRVINRSPLKIGLVWNRPFSLFFLLATSMGQILLN